MGSSHTVYMANKTGQDIYVMASLSKDWAIVNVLVDVGLMFAGVGEIKSVVSAAQLPKTLATFRDIFEFMKIAGTLLGGMVAVGTRPAEAALALLDAFKQTAVRIPNGEYREVERESFLSIYLNADGVASILGARNISVMVVTSDGKQLASWDTNADHSWIATPSRIVRSKYGTIWEQDPAAGSVAWE